jgi:Response regulators consisting of a CheY-like receiver domain and a winged-helix DNA-binding domain
MNGKRVLVVDDNLVDARALTNKLRSEGYEVLFAQDGAAAVSTARKQKLDLIFLDITFPPDVGHGGGVPWDGFLILNWIRRLDEAKHVPVIFVTGADPKKYRDRALNAGAANFFSKPVKPDELIVAVNALLGQASPQQAVPSKKTVLFVDDEGDWRLVAGECLRDAGFNIVTAKDEAEALRRMETMKLDGIVLDLNLGGQNGLLLMELLKQRHPGVPILIYTGMDHNNSAITEMLKSGAKKYLRKGSMTELCDTLKAMVN